LRNPLKCPYHRQEECLWQAHEDNRGAALFRTGWAPRPSVTANTFHRLTSKCPAFSRKRETPPSFLGRRCHGCSRIVNPVLSSTCLSWGSGSQGAFLPTHPYLLPRLKKGRSCTPTTPSPCLHGRVWG
jgi:hypothetical protein